MFYEHLGKELLIFIFLIQKLVYLNKTFSIFAAASQNSIEAVLSTE